VASALFGRRAMAGIGLYGISASQCIFREKLKKSGRRNVIGKYKIIIKRSRK